MEISNTEEFYNDSVMKGDDVCASCEACGWCGDVCDDTGSDCDCPGNDTMSKNVNILELL